MYMKNLLRTVLTLFVAVIATGAMAQTWDGTTASAYAGGSGSKSNPYQISNAKEFAYFAKQMQESASMSEGKYFVLTADIVMNDKVLNDDGSLNGTPRVCEMVGKFNSDSDYVPFVGHFDGKGHTISGFYNNAGSNHTAMFRWTEGAVIKNLGVKDSYIAGNAYSALLVGRQMKGTRILNCWTQGSVYGPGNSESSGSNHAGITGWCFDGSEVLNSYFLGGKITGKNNFGGIAGRIGNNTTSTGLVCNCFAIVTDVKDNNRGIICATLDAGSTISHCYGTGASVLAFAQNGTVESSDVKTEQAMKMAAFVFLLNAQYDALDGVCKWKAGTTYPVHDYTTCKEETGGIDFDALATEPSPGSGITNADGDDGTITLGWKVAANGKTTAQRLYLANDEVTLEDNLIATLGTEQQYTVNVPSMKTYYWRVDQIQADGTVTVGTVWNFTVRTLAFPGAEGGGKYTTGGRGGKVLHVTNLNDSGTGSLRWALGQSGTRTIVFDVAGTIELNSMLSITTGNVTIAGQTAPGDGICLKNYTFNISANNVIIRYIRCRMGDEKKTEDDAMNCYAGGTNSFKNIIIDHCSISWSTDECASFYGVKDFSFQWNIISEPLQNSVHDKGAHGYGGIWGGQNATFHHNLIAHSNSRNPRFDHYYVNQLPGTIDFTNNVVYNWKSNVAYGGETSMANADRKINFVGNYYKPGPASGSKKSTLFNLTNKCDNCMKPAVHGTAIIPATTYMSGNIMEGNSSVNADNWKGVKPDNTIADMTPYMAQQRIETTPLDKVDDAADAFDLVVKYAGASLRRDAVDTRVTDDTRNGTATIKDGGNGSTNGIIDTQAAVGGWPVLTATAEEKAAAALDTNANGIPDGAEQQIFGTLVDGNATDKDPRLTNLEYYLAWLVKDITDHTTAIDAVVIDHQPSFSNACYNLAGQRVTDSAKGIIIKGGKKYVK